MRAWVLIVPLFLIRYGLLGLMNREALGRAAHFAPMAGRERAVFYLYEASNLVLIAAPFFLTIRTQPPLFWAGLTVYVLGIAVQAVSTAAFARPGAEGLNTCGIYRLSRNPMYVGYFLYFLGVAALTRSPGYLLAVLLFQGSAHWVILAEERWCLQRFGEAYRRYMGEVGRYL